MNDFKLILIEEESCANCYQMQDIIKPLCEKKQIVFEILKKDNVDREFIEKHEIKALPAGLLFKGDALLGKFKGYQPDEILEIWLDIKMNERGNS